MCCRLTWISDPQKDKKTKQNNECVFIHNFDATNNISQLFPSKTVEASAATFGCALGGSLQNIWV
jgi:hypothetical protein